MVQAYDHIHGFAIGLQIHENRPTTRLPAQRQKFPACSITCSTFQPRSLRTGPISIKRLAPAPRRVHLRASLPATILREGKLLYAA
jgi:hypothetical protein